MRSIALVLLSLILSGCQINPYTFHPDWTSPSWFDAGKEDAMNGLPVKDNQTLADNFNDPQVDRSEHPPVMTEEIAAVIEHDRKELSGEFCRGCGYCMPCPAGIEINNCARMSLMLRRAPSEAQLTPEMQAKMKKIEDCLHCNKCKSKCPYGLDTPALLAKNYEDYKRVLAGEVSVK